MGGSRAHLNHIWLDSIVGFIIIEIGNKNCQSGLSNCFTYINLFNHQTALYMYVQLLPPFYTLGGEGNGN